MCDTTEKLIKAYAYNLPLKVIKRFRKITIYSWHWVSNSLSVNIAIVFLCDYYFTHVCLFLYV